MIASLAYLLLYLSLGMLTVRFLLPRHKPLNRIWIGLSLGVLEGMWFPALAAFFLGFTAAGHAAAAGVLLLITVTGGIRPRGTKKRKSSCTGSCRSLFR